MTRRNQPAAATPFRAGRRPALRCALLAGGALGMLAGCADRLDRLGPGAADQRPATQGPWVVALGNLQAAPAPSRAEVELAMFLFGVEPQPPLGLVKPAGIAATGTDLLICDTVLNAALRWDRTTGTLSEYRFAQRPLGPVAIDVAPNGDVLIADVAGPSVRRYDGTGRLVRSYELDGGDFRPAAVLCVDQTVWVSNVAADRVEVFDGQTGRHLRSLGAPGTGAGQFGVPLGMARTPDGEICVVDMLNDRVQVFDAAGNWRRYIGRPGNQVGRFGRPKDVAVGPDGVVFVADAASQRVHAFTSDGRPLIAFGQSGGERLAVPAGISISKDAPVEQAALPADFTAKYYVLVSEQVLEPGVRIYAWGGDQSAAAGFPPPIAGTSDAQVRPGGPSGDDPHWRAERCTSCHRRQDRRLLPIASAAVAGVCAACHDGHAGGAWAHPVDRVAEGPGLHTPADWPLVDGRLGCLTCHDVRRHCSPQARRPAVNAAMLREFEPRNKRAFCGKCHVDTAGWVASPHGQLNGAGQVNRQSCLFCHRARPPVPSDGRRRFDAKLRSTSGSCLYCHAKHWDYYPARHVDRLVPPAFRRRMLARESLGPPGLTVAEVDARASGPERRPALLPLADGRIACYTCHNPHQAGLFPPGSQLATRATSPAEAAYLLRADRPVLCLLCHDK